MLTSVEAEFVISHKDIAVYHTYKDDNADNGCNTYWYTTDIYGSEEGCAVFDIRDIIIKLQVEYPDMIVDIDNADNHEEIIRYAIDLSIIKDRLDLD